MISPSIGPSAFSPTGRDDLLDALSTMLDEGRRRGPVAVILIEFDRGPGDESAARIHALLADDDHTYRLSDDRLAIVRPVVTAPAEAVGLARELLEALVTTEPGNHRSERDDRANGDDGANGDDRANGVAIGTATSLGPDPAHRLLAYAEHALIEARIAGPDLVVEFDDEDRDLLELD